MRRGWRWLGALLAGFAYPAASYFAQAAFKETIEALLLLAFVIVLREFAGRDALAASAAGGAARGARRGRHLRLQLHRHRLAAAVLVVAGALAAALQAGPAFAQRGSELLRDAALPLGVGGARVRRARRAPTSGG